MGPASRYAYLHGRVSLMGARLLSEAALASLCQAPPDQETELLEAGGLKPPSEEQTVGASRSLEQRLISNLLVDIVVLTRALTGGARDFLIYWAYRFELSNLKTILRAKLYGESAANVREQLFDMGPFARLPIEELLRTEDVTELLRRLEGTPYADIARQGRRIYDEQHEPFALDAAVDRQYYAGLVKRAREAEGGGDPLRALVGNLIDRINLLWLLRYRFAYGLPAGETYYLLIPAAYRLGGTELQRLSQLGSFEEVIANVPPPWGPLLEGAPNAAEVTLRLERDTWRLARDIMARGVFTTARAFAYLILREKELRQIRALVKGKRLAVAPELVREAMGLEAA